MKAKHLDTFHLQVYDLDILGFSLRVKLSDECFGFNKIQHVKLIVS